MSIMLRGFLGLVAWLLLGFVFTEVTVLALNAWVMHEAQRHEQTSIASQLPGPN
jgi:hypothetical protein